LEAISSAILVSFAFLIFAKVSTSLPPQGFRVGGGDNVIVKSDAARGGNFSAGFGRGGSEIIPATLGHMQ
jgi:hypothetical protein